MPELHANEPILQVAGLSKFFPGVRALDDVQLHVKRGTVHAVMGENGAGKSTLMKVLIGLLQPEAGTIQLNGQRVHFRSPHDALQAGLSMIHQELMPFPDLTVAENIFMGREPAWGWPGWINRRALQLQTKDLLNRLGIPLRPEQPMRQLTVAEMQTVEIAKALAYDAEVIIMDEPTSAISEREVERLFAIIRDLKHRGVAVIYISHKMDEVFRLADEVTVLRDGRYVATKPIAELDRDQLIALMVGRALKPSAANGRAVASDVALSVRGLSRAGKFRNARFDLRRGEVLGLAGLMGAGRTELVSALYGFPPADDGELLLDGRPVRIRHPREALAHGIAMVSEDRKTYGLVMPLSVKENISLSQLGRCCAGPFIRPGLENQLADASIRSLKIKSAHRNQGVDSLSGGNQQKVVIAKALLNEPSVLILDEPTRGIDIGAKAEVHHLVRSLAHQGKAILLVSSELPELLALSHRILVMREGELTGELDPRQTTQEEILKLAMPE